MTKQEAIKQAYGEHWEQVKEKVTNNGWIKIESEADLPKEDGFYWMKDKEFGVDMAQYFSEEKKWFCSNVRQFPTHYQPIVKPKPPIF